MVYIISINEALKPTNDYVFKRIFGKKGNEDITKDFINSVLKKDVEIVSLEENPILEKDFRSDKLGILDVKAKLDNKTLCDIEMQVVKYAGMTKRAIFYWSKLFLEGIKEGQGYTRLEKAIVILITEYGLDELKDIPKAHTKWEIREEEFTTKILTDVFEIHIIELAKLKSQIAENGIDKKDKLLQWATFMLYPEKIGDEIIMENVEMKKALEEWRKIDQSKEEREIAWRRLVSIMDENSIKESGYQEGEEKGKTETQKKVAKKLLEMNISIEQIVEATELTEEEINKLR